jgi:hypothetical protein
MQRGPRGNKHEVTDERKRFVEALAVLGKTEADIGLVLDINEKTLRRHYKAELAKAAIMADADVTQTLLNQARGGPEKDWRLANPASTIFWAKTRLGFRTPDPFDEVDANGVRVIRILNSPESTRLNPPRLNGADRDGEGDDLDLN